MEVRLYYTSPQLDNDITVASH